MLSDAYVLKYTYTVARLRGCNTLSKRIETAGAMVLGSWRRVALDGAAATRLSGCKSTLHFRCVIHLKSSPSMSGVL